MHRHHVSNSVAITGGAGFIGHRLAHRLLAEGNRVTILDDLSAVSAAENLTWLRARHGPRLRLVLADVRDTTARQEAFEGAKVIFHLAAQPSSAGSMAHPRRDFEVNAKATGDLVADLVKMPSPPVLVFASSREVYGPLKQVDVRVRGPRMEPLSDTVRAFGLSEATPANFTTPLGCSKTAAEQHVQWAATRGVPSIVLRLGAVYGPQGRGADDSDWLADLVLRAVRGNGVCLHGDGRQVRDWLYVDDAAEALAAAATQSGRFPGAIFQAGGGTANSASELELLAILCPPGRTPVVSYLPRLSGDPNYFVCDNRRFATASGWKPKTRLTSGAQRLRRWALSASPAITQGVA